MTMQSDSSFRAHLPDLNMDRFTAMREQDCYQYAVTFKEKKNPPWLHALYEHWQGLLSEPFKGITANALRDKTTFVLTMSLFVEDYSQIYSSWKTKGFPLSTLSKPQN
ncbi:hypothetical protein E5D57_001757 [Metarhizium anisopliae]|nr:hypothetical protein E5D57_001757 [Metarhizium anisopliae]